MRFFQGNEGTHFFEYLKDAFDVLYEEGNDSPKMMSIGLHCRIIGRPARIRALERFLDYIASKEKIWICTRLDIAKHWHQNHAPHKNQ
jgi:allantoinase